MKRSIAAVIFVAAFALTLPSSSRGQAPAPGRGAGLGAPANAPPPRSVTPGPYTVHVESYPTLATHTAYHPEALQSFGPSKRLPIVAWGNGACARNGSAFATFLTQIASHGYLAIAIGPKDGDPRGASPAPVIDDRLLVDAIDWAARENGDRGSRFYNKLDTARIAVMGQSCGGLQALAVSGDPRVTTTVVMNSGAFPPGASSLALLQSDHAERHVVELVRPHLEQLVAGQALEHGAQLAPGVRVGGEP